MLVAVVGVFLVVEVPLAILLILLIVSNTFEIYIIDSGAYEVATLFVNDLSNSSFRLDACYFHVISDHPYWYRLPIKVQLTDTHFSCRTTPTRSIPELSGVWGSEVFAFSRIVPRRLVLWAEPGCATLFVNMVIVLSYPFNFVIYCAMSRQFRATFRSMFCPGSVPAVGGAAVDGTAHPGRNMEHTNE